MSLNRLSAEVGCGKTALVKDYKPQLPMRSVPGSGEGSQPGLNGERTNFIDLVSIFGKETNVKLNRLALTLGMAALLCASSAFAQVTYSFKTVNYPNDTFTQLLGINNSGDIAGYHGATVNKGFTYN